jgi:hypothetical protein
LRRSQWWRVVPLGVVICLSQTCLKNPVGYRYCSIHSSRRWCGLCSKSLCVDDCNTKWAFEVLRVAGISSPVSSNMDEPTVTLNQNRKLSTRCQPQKIYFEHISSVEVDVSCDFGNLIPEVDGMEREQREQMCLRCFNKVTRSFASKSNIVIQSPGFKRCFWSRTHSACDFFTI